MHRWLVGGIMFVVLEALVYWQYQLADADSMRTVAQMKVKGISQGLPLEYHFGISGDWYYLSLLVAVIVALYASQWQKRDLAKAIGFAFTSSLVMGLVWLLPETPEAHVQNHAPTPAAWVHLTYMVIAIAVFVLLYFFTPWPATWLVCLTSIVLPVHLWIGSHMLLGLMKHIHPAGYSWYPDQPLNNWLGWGLVVLVTLGLSWRTVVIDARSREHG